MQNINLGPFCGPIYGKSPTIMAPCRYRAVDFWKLRNGKVEAVGWLGVLGGLVRTPQELHNIMDYG